MGASAPEMPTASASEMKKSKTATLKQGAAAIKQGVVAHVAHQSSHESRKRLEALEKRVTIQPNLVMRVEACERKITDNSQSLTTLHASIAEMHAAMCMDALRMT